MQNSFLQNGQQGKSSIFRYLLTIFLIIIIGLSAAVLIVTAAILYTGNIELDQYSPRLLFLLNMFIFPVELLALWIGIRFIHKRKFVSLISGEKNIAWKRLFISMLMWVALCALTDLALFIISPEMYQWSFSLEEFLPFFFLIVLFVPIQSATEELLIRGYLMQGLASVTRSPLFAVVVSSLLFAGLHIGNPEVESYGFFIMMAHYLCMGLFMAYITLKSEGLEAAMGIHIANNLYAFLFVSIPDSALPTPSLFKVIHYDSTMGLISLLVCSVIFIIIFKTRYSGSQSESQQSIQSIG